jgi:DNA mismatch repair protein MutL
MAQVQVLDENTANQIAAGEVVERPAAAVKELVENALDAGARQILVELDEGGKYLIRVTDDGSGMSREDAVLSLQRHATSKIRSADDLFQITTMGFRGEALPSIASVSQMSVTTKAAGDDEAAGVQIKCSGGLLEEVSEVGARPGTSITVENLFYNVPARLKFLKSSSTELNHIVELMQRFALARPDAAFRLLHGGGEVFASGGSGVAMDACVHVFGRETARHLVPLRYEVSGLRVTGYIGTPAALKSSRSAQHTFVNKRFVRNKAVTRALDEAYKSVQTAVVMIDIDPSQVDVNVSPTKTEVRFTSEGDIYAAVYKAVQEALMAGGLVPTLTQKLNATASVSPASADRSGGQEHPSLMSVPARPAGNTRQEPRDMTAFRDAYQERAQNGFDDDPFEGGPVSSSSPLPSAAPSRQASVAGSREGRGVGTSETAVGADYREHNLDSLRVLAQTRNMYILAQTDNALVLIDQHIAHERVLYEQLLAGAEGAGGGVPTQRLMLPFTLELSRRETLVI